MNRYSPADIVVHQLSISRNLKLVDIAGKLDRSESGRSARPMSPDWARSLRDQCAAAGVPFLFKQWGEWIPMLGQVDRAPVGEKTTTTDGWVMGWAGKKAAGRLLDDTLHDAFPVTALDVGAACERALARGGL